MPSEARFGVQKKKKKQERKNEKKRNETNKQAWSWRRSDVGLMLSPNEPLSQLGADMRVTAKFRKSYFVSQLFLARTRKSIVNNFEYFSIDSKHRIKKHIGLFCTKDFDSSLITNQ